MKRIAPLALCASATLLLAADGPPPAPVTVTKENAGTFYKEYRRLTARLHPTTALIALDCVSRPPIKTREALAKEQARLGPHYNQGIHVYANASADEAIQRKAERMPVGAVIVKEKLSAESAITGIGGMIKRAPGYDPANGDWEYFFYTPGKSLDSGKLANCAGCHSGAAKDFVFNAWTVK